MARSSSARGTKFAAIALVGLVVVAALAAGGWYLFLRSRGTALAFGDSLVFQARQELRSEFKAHGVDVHIGGFPGTGPLDDQGEWLDLLASELEDHEPGVVVLEACCNYNTTGGQPYQLPDGSVVRADTEAFFETWRSISQQMVDLAAGQGAEVYWALTPPPSPDLGEILADRIERLNDIYRDLSGVTVIDWADAVAPDGYTAELERPDGTTVPVRQDDGLHLTERGSEIVAERTWKAVEGAF